MANIVIENAEILPGRWRNFSGRPTTFNRDGGKRVFNIIFGSDMAQKLTNDGDIEIRPYDYDYNGRQGRKAYLKTMYVSIETSELDEKYGYFDMEEPAPEEDF